MLRERDPQPSLWEALLPAELKRLPVELEAIDACLDDERVIAPWRTRFDRRLGRPSVPVDTLLRLVDLKHRDQLGYESLCREVSDSIGWRRFCRIGLQAPVPHPTTLVKLVRRAGPEVIGQRNTALLDKLASPTTSCCGAASCGSTPPWWRPTSTIPPTPTCWSRRCASSAGWCATSRPAGPPVAPRFVIVVVRLAGGCGRRLRQLARTLRRRTGVAMAEVDRLTGEVAKIARRSLRQVQAVARNARRAHARRPADPATGGLVDWSAS